MCGVDISLFYGVVVAFRHRAVIHVEWLCFTLRGCQVKVDKGSGEERAAPSLPVHEPFLYQSCSDGSKAAARDWVGHSVLRFHRFDAF